MLTGQKDGRGIKRPPLATRTQNRSLKLFELSRPTLLFFSFHYSSCSVEHSRRSNVRPFDVMEQLS